MWVLWILQIKNNVLVLNKDIDAFNNDKNKWTLKYHSNESHWIFWESKSVLCGDELIHGGDCEYCEHLSLHRKCKLGNFEIIKNWSHAM